MTMTQDEMVLQLQEEMCSEDCQFDEEEMFGFHEETDIAHIFFKKKKGFLYKVQAKVSNGLKNLPFEFHKQDEVFMFAREFSKHDIAICVYVSQWDSYGVLRKTWIFADGKRIQKEN